MAMDSEAPKEHATCKREARVKEPATARPASKATATPTKGGDITYAKHMEIARQLDKKP